MPGYLRNVWVSGKFPKYLGIWEVSQIPRHLRNFQNLKNIPPSNTYRYLGNFPNAWVSEKCLGIWEISQIPGYLGNFPNTQAFEKFSKFLFSSKVSLLSDFTLLAFALSSYFINPIFWNHIAV